MSIARGKPIDEHQRRRFLDEMNRGFAALREDPDAWREELAERRAWGGTLMDDLEND